MDDDATVESRKVWDSVAEAWDKERAFLNERERPVTERLLEALGVQAGDRILELCAGPGEVGLTLAARHPEARVLITDFAPRMVEAASAAAAGRGLGNVELRLMDAQDIDLPDASVDGVLCRYGLMLVPHIPEAFAGIRRVLRPGRILAYTTWAPPEMNPWMTILGATLMQRGHFQPPEGAQGFPLGDEASNLDVARAAGFEDVSWEPVDVTLRFPTFQRYWELTTGVAGPLVGIVKGLPDDEREAVRAQIEEYAAPFRTDGGLSFPSRRNLIRAR